MGFLDIAKSRYSVRGYDNKEVEKDKLLQILEAGRLAPSAVNYQPVHFIVITDEEQKKKIYETYPRGWLEEAPVIIVACGDHSVSWKRRDGKDHCDIDVAIAVDHMTLAAADLGLGTCWICAFDAEKCSKLLKLPDNLEPMVLLPVGYPKQGRLTEIKRKGLDEIVSWEEYKKIK